MVRKAVLIAFALVGIFLGTYLLFGEQSQIARAQGCSGQLTMEPTDPYTLGTHVILRGTSNCGTVRFEIKGNGRTWHKAEIGTSNQIETWKTEETGSGTFEVCFVARGEGGWERAHRSCRTVFVEGGQAPPPGSQQGANVKCWVNSFNITPGSVQIGQTVNFAAQGQCDGNMRAARFTIDGNGWGEHTTNTHNTGWNTSGYSAGNHQICYQVTAGDWGQAASSCVSVTLTQAPPPTPYVEQGPPADNGVPGQTVDSSPSMVDHPQGNPPPAQVAPPAQPPPPPASNSSYNSNPGAGSVSNAGSDVAPDYNIGSATCNANSRLRIGEIAVVSDATPDPLPLRSGPTTNDAILIQIPVRQLITIIGGPVCSGKFVWWETQYGGRTGWTAEINGYGNHNLLLNGAPLPGSSSGSNSSNSGAGSVSSSSSSSSQSGSLLPPNLAVGMRARVTYYPPDPNTLRDRPSPSGVRLRSMPPGTEFTIIDGPVVSTYRYWKVRLDDGTVGWTAEVDSKTRWLEPVDSGSTLAPHADACTALTPGVGMVWLSEFEYFQLVQSYEQLEQQTLAELGIWMWIAEEHIAEPIAERLIARIGLSLKLNGERLNRFIFGFSDFLFGSNADVLTTLERIRSWKVALIQDGANPNNQRSGCRQVLASLYYERPSPSFEYYWLGAFDIFPYAQLIECYYHPENCGTLFSLFDATEVVTGGGGSW